jgi:hypothetical protein
MLPENTRFGQRQYGLRHFSTIAEFYELKLPLAAGSRIREYISEAVLKNCHEDPRAQSRISGKKILKNLSRPAGMVSL